MQRVISKTQSFDPMFNFLYALKAPETKRQYPKRFEMFLNFLKLYGDLNKKAYNFIKKQNQIHNGYKTIS